MIAHRPRVHSASRGWRLRVAPLLSAALLSALGFPGTPRGTPRLSEHLVEFVSRVPLQAAQDVAIDVER